MNTKWNSVKIVLAAVLGSLFWAGCASAPAPHPKMVERTVDLSTTGPDTRPQDRTGLYNFTWQNYDIKSIE